MHAPNYPTHVLTQVRQYSIEDRKGLTNIKNASWKDTFHKVRCSVVTPTDTVYYLGLETCQQLMQYLEDLQCPIAHESGSDAAVLDWLLNYAISLEYQDQGEVQCQHSTAPHALLQVYALAAERYTTAGPSQKRQKPLPSTLQKEQQIYTDSEGSSLVMLIAPLPFACRLDKMCCLAQLVTHRFQKPSSTCSGSCS